jgi:hypothetical protein
MTSSAYIRLVGSDRTELPGARLEGPADPAARVEVTLVTRRAVALPRTAGGAGWPTAMAAAASRWWQAPRRA